MLLLKHSPPLRVGGSSQNLISALLVSFSRRSLESTDSRAFFQQEIDGNSRRDFCQQAKSQQAIVDNSRREFLQQEKCQQAKSNFFSKERGSSKERRLFYCFSGFSCSAGFGFSGSRLFGRSYSSLNATDFISRKTNSASTRVFFRPW